MTLVKNPILMNYSEARHKIRDGDVLMFRRNWRPSNWLIAKLGRTPSPYCHAAMACWVRERLFSWEMIQKQGGRCCALSQQVEAYPEMWDIYRVSPRKLCNRAKAVRHMIGLVGVKYGWKALLRAAIVHLPFVRWLLTAEEEDTPGELPFCSMAVSAALRAGGLDPCPELADGFTEPGDLADSPYLEYKFTLCWDTSQGEEK